MESSKIQNFRAGADGPHSSSHSKETSEDIPHINVFAVNSIIDGPPQCLFPRILTVRTRSTIDKSAERKCAKGQQYWQQVKQCEKLFGKSIAPPESNDKSLKNDLWRNNFFRGFSNDNPYQTEIMNWMPEMKYFVGSDSPNPVPVYECSKIQFIDTVRQLRPVVQDFHLGNYDTAAFDLEFHNRNVYGSTISSTLQISYGCNNLVIDCLNGYSRQGIRHGIHKILEDKNIIKIGCGVREDVKALQKDFGIYIHPVIDLQLAFFVWQRIHQVCCVVCNRQHCQETNECKSPAMDKIIKYLYPQIEVNKLPQKADWSMRPLPTELIVYASLDTSILLKIWNHIKPTFGQSERNFLKFKHDVVEPSKAIALSKVNWNNDHDKYSKWIRKQSITTEDAEMLENIFIARDWICRKYNKDAEKFLPKEVCFKIMKTSQNLNGDQYSKELSKLLPESSGEFEITLLDVMHGNSLQVPDDIVINEKIECSRCHQTAHTMGQCALPRYRNDDGKKKNKDRYRKKRAQQSHDKLHRF